MAELRGAFELRQFPAGSVHNQGQRHAIRLAGRAN
jgi:hypothetical protein